MLFCLLTILTITFSPIDKTFYNEHLYVPMTPDNTQSVTYYHSPQYIRAEGRKKALYETPHKRTTSINNHLSTGVTNGNIIVKNSHKNDAVIYGQQLYAPPSRNKVCQYCGGTGWINDYGNGELYTGTWYFYVNGYYDGHSCTNTEAYHDECDDVTYGEVYHHFYKTKCPFCNGTGYNGKSNSNWTSWNGSGWTHLFTDNDDNGHCDEHQWHELTPVGDVPVLFFILLFGFSICYIRNKKGDH